MASFWWGIALVSLLIWVVYYIITLKRNPSLRLLGLVPLAGAIGVFGLYLAVIWGGSVVWGYRCRNIGWVAQPLCILLIALYYPVRHPLTRSSWFLPALALAPIVSLVVTDPLLFTDFQHRFYPLPIIIWMVAYFIAALFLLFRSMSVVRLPIIRYQLFYLTTGMMIGTGNHLITNIILPLFGNRQYWKFNFVWIILASLLIALGFLRHDVFRWQLLSKNKLVNSEIEAMESGARVLAHIMKNHLTVIDYMASQAEQGKTEKLHEIRRTCQNICQRLNEVGEMPVIDSKLETIIKPEELYEEALKVSVPDGQSIVGTMNLSLPHIKGSRGQLQMAFCHLVQNASESMRTGGEIRIEAQQEGDYLVTRIADQGVGIAKDRLKNIYKPFHTSKSLYESWGLGLSFVHQVFTAHQGGLIVESNPGLGTAFIAFLPIWSGQKQDVKRRKWSFCRRLTKNKGE